MILNTAPNEMITPLADVTAHEVAYMMHNRGGLADNPLQGVSPEAMSEFDATSGMRAAQPGAGRSLKGYINFQSGPEKFAEGFRSYATKPNALK